MRLELEKIKLLTVGEWTKTSIEILYDDSVTNFDILRMYVVDVFESIIPNEKNHSAAFHFHVDRWDDEEDESETEAEENEVNSEDEADEPKSKVAADSAEGETDSIEEDLQRILSSSSISAKSKDKKRNEDERIDSDEKPSQSETLVSEEFSRLLGLDDIESVDEENQKKKAKMSEKESEELEEKKASAADKINGLVGAAEFKALAKEIVVIAEEVKRTKTYEVFTNQCYLFSIGDGYGLTTYLNLLADLVSESGLCEISPYSVMERAIEPYNRENSDPFINVKRALESGGSKVKVLSIDISDWMDKTEDRNFKQFLRVVEKHADEFIVVFRVPFVDKDVLARIKYSLNDLLSVKTVSFPPFSQDEIKALAEAELKKYNFTITKSAWRFFLDRISEEKSDGKFYGANTIKKVVRELVYQKHVLNSQKQEKSNQITVSDTKLLCGEIADNSLSGMEQLDKLVGVDGVKKRVEEIITQIELALKDSTMQKPCIHMRFVGNPGTGKTTVARIVGKILKEKGVLRVGAFFEYAGRDFCGRYIGETAPKTAGMCRDAYGSVLFIDEAYTLYRGDGDSKDFGREAIDTLIAEMENHRSDFMVIMAGYNDDMDRLMSGNVGLASRMPYTIEFPNFTREQLYDIYVSMVKSKFKFDDKLFDVARKFFNDLPDSLLNAKDFSNARYSRNLFERTWAKAAMRCQLNGKTEVTLTAEDFEIASADNEFAVKIPKKTKIGF